MFGALKKLFGAIGLLEAHESKGVAKSRLHFVLVQDRTGLTAEEMGLFRKEIMSVIDKYFQMDEDGLDVSYKRETGTTTLLINSPVLLRRKGAKPQEAVAGKGKTAVTADTKPAKGEPVAANAGKN